MSTVHHSKIVANASASFIDLINWNFRIKIEINHLQCCDNINGTNEIHVLTRYEFHLTKCENVVV